MDVENITHKILQYFSWLYYRRWETWELLGIGVIIVVLLILGIRSHLRKMHYARHHAKWPILH